jgi:D-glycero-D-manno-heptose 1,7-bisphosphate phosphatase
VNLRLKRSLNKAVFLDRDGVINVDYGYVSLPEQFEFIEGVFEACLHLQRLGYMLIIITNQSGIARGYYTIDQFSKLTSWMCHKFAINGININGVYYCPHHPDTGILPYVQKCQCRKPAPGMLLQAISEHNIDRKKSFMVGDKISDLQAAAAAGIGFKILLGSASVSEICDSAIVDAVWPNLHAASVNISC